MRSLERAFNKIIIKLTDLYMEKYCNRACYFFWYQPRIPEIIMKKYKR